MKNIQILGTGHYLPSQIVPSSSLDAKLNKPDGWVQKKSGLIQRHFASFETSAYMGAQAALEALHHAKLELKDIDCLVSACGVMQQAIPVNAVLIKEQLQLKTNIPCFDINSTCLSFLTALDLISDSIQSGKYKNILLVSSEMPSSGLDWSDPESCTIFGDGAAAMIISANKAPQSSAILGSCFETHIKGADFCVLSGGGTKLAQAKLDHFDKNNYQFHMQGKKVFKLARHLLPKMLDNFFKKHNIDKKAIDWIVPHQASGLALAHIKKTLGFCSTKFLDEISHLGNQMSASIPLVFHLNVQKNKIKRGDRVLMLGTGAGLSMGLILLEY